MKQTDFLIRVKHTRAFSKESIALILKAHGGLGVEVTILDSEDDSKLQTGKLLRYMGRGKFSIEPFQTQARIE